MTKPPEKLRQRTGLLYALTGIQAGHHPLCSLPITNIRDPPLSMPYEGATVPAYSQGPLTCRLSHTGRPTGPMGYLQQFTTLNRGRTTLFAGYSLDNVTNREQDQRVFGPGFFSGDFFGGFSAGALRGQSKTTKQTKTPHPPRVRRPPPGPQAAPQRRPRIS